ncbi:hypothetical protein QJK83_18820 [Clostridioides difficile]|nr:hypothetical protein [Clostridioides difficile]EQG89180.1 hypothetical protein QKC_3880 [Clostridioides difficile DA00167]MDA0608230.1 hypothetical protein [Clostridioides difficile]MDI6342909.1 hypothetical protein [Clostridioides difficile]PCD11046.1 hypothetical protein V440_18085 [Clostridioides difficile]
MGMVKLKDMRTKLKGHGKIENEIDVIKTIKFTGKQFNYALLQE